jgi:alpha-tubulin suppressor-like RCC1 family protein
LSVPAGLSNVVAVSAGGFHGSTVLASGTVTQWGDPFFDASVNVPAGLSNVIQTAAGFRFNIALRNDQTFMAWGNNSLTPLNVPPGLNNVVAVAAGWYHGLAVRPDRTVISWGYNAYGQTNVPSGLSNVVAVAGGWMHSMALQEDGSVIAWGLAGQTNVPANATNIVAIAAGAQHSLALRRDGTVLTWGDNTSGKATIPFWLTNVVAVAGGSGHSLALLNDGSPYVVRQPWNQVAWSGANIAFDVAALGHAPLAYQWQFNGADLIGATNSSLVFTNLALDRTGNYRCVISNGVGSVSTRMAALTVLRGTPQFGVSGTGLNDDGTFRLLLAGISGHGNIVLYASTNLIDWQPILTNPPTIGELLFTDSSATNLPQRFYRFEEQ